MTVEIDDALTGLVGLVLVRTMKPDHVTGCMRLRMIDWFVNSNNLPQIDCFDFL
jgi:hypothetical protein